MEDMVIDIYKLVVNIKNMKLYFFKYIFNSFIKNKYIKIINI